MACFDNIVIYLLNFFLTWDTFLLFFIHSFSLAFSFFILEIPKLPNTPRRTIYFDFMSCDIDVTFSFFGGEGEAEGTTPSGYTILLPSVL